MKHFLLTALLALSALSAFARKTGVEGKITDSQGNPLQFVNVVLLSSADSSFVDGAVTDDNGLFSINSLSRGDILKVSFVGYKTQYANIDNPTTKDILITMDEDDNLLGDVTVKSQLPTTRLKHDAMQTFVAGTILEKAGTTTDMLNKVPMLNADENGTVSVLGRGNAEVYINGRKVQDLKELTYLRAEQVECVEVIQNPGAQYSASTKAVVKIRLKKAQGDGISFSEYIYTSHRYHWSFANQFILNYRTGGLDIMGSIYYYNQNTRMLQDNDLEYYSGGKLYVALSKQNRRADYREYQPNIQFNYQINENHSFGAYYKMNNEYKTHSYGWLNTDTYEDDGFLEHSESKILFDGDNRYHNTNAYYNGKVGDLSIDLNIDGQWDNSKQPGSTIEDIFMPDNSIETQSYENTTKTSDNFIATKLVLQFPMAGGDFSLGGEMSHNDRKDSYEYVSSAVVPVQETDTHIKESAYAAFGEYGRQIGNLYANIGLRYEHITNTYYNFGVKDNEACRVSDDLFPSASLTIPVNNLHLSLSYSSDISRPSYSYLSSRMIRISRYTYQCGDPYLKPEYTHDLAFSASYKWANLTINYQNVKDCICERTVEFPNTDDPLISLIQTCNGDKNAYDLSVNLSANPTIGLWHPVWKLSGTSQKYEFMCKEGYLKTLDMPFFKLRWNNDFVLPSVRSGLMKGDWTISANISCNNKGDQVCYRTARDFSSQLIVRHDVCFDKMGTLTFDAKYIDPFETSETKLTLYSSRELSIRRPARKTVSLSATWRFNAAKTKYKGTGAGESQKGRI